jgi:hypothetical protein
MRSRRTHTTWAACGLAALVVACVPILAWAEDLIGVVKSVDVPGKRFVLTLGVEPDKRDVKVRVNEATELKGAGGAANTDLAALKPGTRVRVANAVVAASVTVEPEKETAGTSARSPLAEFWYNFRHNLFKPLLLFFYLGFVIVLLRVEFEFPYVVYQALTIYLLLAIGWHGGEELSGLKTSDLGPVLGFMCTGFALNFVIGIIAFAVLRLATRLREVDQATVAGYYGSDSAGTFVTCLGVLTSAKIAYDAYMPVMLAVMEIPGCLVALYLVSRLRHHGMDALGNMPWEPGYDPQARRPKPAVAAGHGHHHTAVDMEKEMALEKKEYDENGNGNGNGNNGNGARRRPRFGISPKLLHEVFLNPGLVLLFGGIFVGFVSGLQGPDVTRVDDSFFVTLFQGILCLFLLEMGMTAARKLKDLKTAGLGFIAFGLIMPNIFATMGILTAHLYASLTHTHFELGTYVLFSVLCAAASYIAVPAVQRLAIPEASPTLPLAASLGLTFSYNVTIGIPVYIEIAKQVMRAWPV